MITSTAITSFADGGSGSEDRYTSDDFVYVKYKEGIGIVGYKDKSIKSITIPNKLDGYTVTTIESLAFSGCKSLNNIVLPSSVIRIRNFAFVDTGYYNNQANWENNVLYIGNFLIKAKSALAGAYKIKSGTKHIAESAFRDCKNSISVTIPDSVTNIGDNAFGYCTGLTSVTLPSSVTSIGEYAFCDCTGLTSITIPSSVKSIGGRAFYKCSGLTSVTLSSSVTSIGNSAFYECSNLKDVYYGGSKADRDKITIESYNYSLLNAMWHYNSTPTVTLGDINADGNINSNDDLLALQHSVGKTNLTGDKFTAGDVDKNKIINSSDTLKIIQYSVGQITKF